MDDWEPAPEDEAKHVRNMELLTHRFLPAEKGYLPPFPTTEPGRYFDDLGTGLHEYRLNGDGRIARRSGPDVQAGLDERNKTTYEMLRLPSRPVGGSMDKFDEFAATAPPRPPQAPGASSFYGERPLAGVQTTPPFRLPSDMVGPDTRSNPRGLTVLSPDEEKAYSSWRATLPKELQYEGDYDLRGFFHKNPNFHAQQGQHMTDEFKLPNHPTFSNESKYYDPSTARLGGHWAQDVFVPNDEKYKSRVDETPPRKRKRKAIP